MHSDRSPPARRPSSLALVCLTLFLLLLPLTLSKPGLPVVLKADEAAYYLASLSLWQDGDLVCEDLDARRLFREYSGTDNLILMSAGEGRAVYFGVPFVYPLVATPFVGLFGANGMVMLNAGLLSAMIWMGFAYLRRHNGESISALFAAGFFLLSTAFVYVFWLQAEVFGMACVMAAFFLAERAFDGTGTDAGRVGSRWRLAFHTAGSAALLTTVSYSKPMLAVLALPILVLLIRARSWRGLVAFTASGVLTAGLLVGTAYALTEQVWPYFAPRAGISLSSPVDYVERRVAPRLQEQRSEAPSRSLNRAGRQLRVTLIATLVKAAPEFLVGRHGGFLVYMPFAVLAVLFFLLRERRSVFRWLILGSAVVTGVLFVTLVRGQWLGGGGFVGNRYFMAVYPSFLFLVRRIHPPWLIAPGFAAAAVFLGPLLITPLGAPVIEPTLQAHVRNRPFPSLPLEWSLAPRLAGYRDLQMGGVSFHGRRDEIWPYGEEIWVHGAKRVEINLLSPEKRRSFVFDVRNLVSGQELDLCLEGDCRRLRFGDVPALGATERMSFGPLDGEWIPRVGRERETYRYRLLVETEWGEQPRWRGSGGQRFYLGAALLFLGSVEEVAGEADGGAWIWVEVPSSIEAGSTVPVPVALHNSTASYWPDSGPAPIGIVYRWLSADGESVVQRGRRSRLPAAVAAGRELETEVVVSAPPRPGRYLLAFDLVPEPASSSPRAARKRKVRVEVEVVPSESIDQGSAG